MRSRADGKRIVRGFVSHGLSMANLASQLSTFAMGVNRLERCRMPAAGRLCQRGRARQRERRRGDERREQEPPTRRANLVLRKEHVRRQYAVQDIMMIHLSLLFSAQLARSRFVGPGPSRWPRQYAINGSAYFSKLGHYRFRRWPTISLSFSLLRAVSATELLTATAAASVLTHL